MTTPKGIEYGEQMDLVLSVFQNPEVLYPYLPTQKEIDRGEKYFRKLFLISNELSLVRMEEQEKKYCYTICNV